jgi:hypothetical protein
MIFNGRLFAPNPAWISLYFHQIANMNPAATLNLELPVNSIFPASNATDNRLFRYERNRPEMFLEKTINHYLKTSAEMDAEFSMEMNTAKLMTWRQVDTHDTYSTIVFKDGHTNAYSPDVTPSGFMEENY